MIDNITTAVKNNIVIFGLCISVAWVASSFVLANGLGSLRGGDTISVTGTAERVVESDRAKWTLSVTKNASQTEYAPVSKQLSAISIAVRKYLVSKGVEENEITIQPITSSVVCQTQNQVSYDNSGRQQCSGFYTYSLSQMILIESGDVEKIRELALNAPNDLSTIGAQVQTNSVDFLYTDLASLRVELLEEAGKNAKERAEAIAKSTGGRIGGVTNASQGIFQITQKNSTDVSDYGSYDTSTIEKKVTAIVRASFQVK